LNFPRLEHRVSVTSYQSLTGSGKEVAFSLLAAQALLNFKATGSNRFPSSRPDRFAHRIPYFQILLLTLLADIFRPRRERRSQAKKPDDSELIKALSYFC